MEYFITTCGIKRILNDKKIFFETKTENGKAIAIILYKKNKIEVIKNISNFLETRKENTHQCTHDYLINNAGDLAKSEALKKAYLIYNKIYNDEN